MREELTETDGKRRARSAAKELREMTRVRFDDSIDAPAKRVGLDSIRVAEAVPSGKEEK
jgi:hypothetical protein